mgnify:CR=1 FL=1
MLKSLTIQSFKAISSPVTIPLGAFNVIIGRNGSGKSSAIEALSWLGECISSGAADATRPFHRIDDLIYGGREGFNLSLAFDPHDFSVGSLVEFGLDVTKRDGRPLISSEFLRYCSGDIKTDRITTGAEGRRYELSLTGQIPQKERDLIRKRAKGNKADQPLENILYLLDNLEAQQFAATSNDNELLLKLVDPKADRGGTLLRDTLERLVTLHLSPKAIGSFSDPVSEATSKKLLDEQGLGVARLLSDLDEETRTILIEKVSFVTGRTQGCQVHEPNGPADRRYFGFNETIAGSPSDIPSWMLSEGTRRITAILALLLHDNPPPILCIEEIENGLDPWTIQFLLEELSAASLSGTQVIITTHSPYLLNLIPIENILLVDRSDEKVSFIPGSKIKGLSHIFDHMGAGDMYTARYLHDKSREAGE